MPEEADKLKMARGYQRDIAELRGNTRLLKWMAATNLAFTMAILWRVFYKKGRHCKEAALSNSVPAQSASGFFTPNSWLDPPAYWRQSKAFSSAGLRRLFQSDARH